MVFKCLTVLLVKPKCNPRRDSLSPFSYASSIWSSLVLLCVRGGWTCLQWTSGLYYKHITIINDGSRDISKWRSKLWRYSDVSRGVICNHIIFMIYTLRVVNYAPRNIYSTGITHDDWHLWSSYFNGSSHSSSDTPFSIILFHWKHINRRVNLGRKWARTISRFSGGRTEPISESVGPRQPPFRQRRPSRESPFRRSGFCGFAALRRRRCSDRFVFLPFADLFNEILNGRR
jgi:hypothetical protein